MVITTSLQASQLGVEEARIGPLARTGPPVEEVAEVATQPGAKAVDKAEAAITRIKAGTNKVGAKAGATSKTMTSTVTDPGPHWQP